MRTLPHIVLTAIMAALALPCTVAANELGDALTTEPSAVEAPADSVFTPSVAPDDDIPLDDEAMLSDTVGRPRRNTATGFNAIDYVYESRHLYRGDTFRKRWYDNIYLQGGVGLEKLNEPDDNYRFGMLNSLHFGIGKQINRLNAVRLSLHAAFGFQNGTDIMFGKGGARLDHLFNLTSYFNGYDPLRKFEVSTLIGVGAQASKLRLNSPLELSYEGHAGLQLKFCTGPQGYIALEPYVGISTDKADISGDHNWRGYDIFYGANLSYVYYLGNSLSDRRRRQLTLERGEDDRPVDEKTLSSWHRPWFFELSAGPHFMDSPELGVMATMAHSTTASVGKWLSPVIGVRFSGSMRSAKWTEMTHASSYDPMSPEYDMSYYKCYMGVGVDALFNPLGFSKKFSWDAPYGFHLLFGGELGRIVRYNHGEHLNTNSPSYSLGAHFWARVSDGVQVFVEPRGTWYVYDIPYRGAKQSMRCTDGGMSVNIGVSVTTANRYADSPKAPSTLPRNRFSFGLGGGLSLIYRSRAVDGGGANYNFEGWGEWHVTRLHSLRLAFEYLSVGSKYPERFYDYNLDYPDMDYLRTTRRGLWHRRYGMGVVQLNYSFNFTEAFCPYNPKRLLDISAFAGPSFVFFLNDKATIDSEERVQANHRVEPVIQLADGIQLGANLGIRVTAHVLPYLDVYLSPQVMLWRRLFMNSVDFMQFKHIESLNLGVQYNF